MLLSPRPYRPRTVNDNFSIVETRTLQLGTIPRTRNRWLLTPELGRYRKLNLGKHGHCSGPGTQDDNGLD